jgi:high-affinity Fe2+/Pb2+ permease
MSRRGTEGDCGLADILPDSDVLAMATIAAVVVGLLLGMFVYAGTRESSGNIYAVTTTVVFGTGIFVLVSIGLGGLRNKYSGNRRNGE